MFRYFVKRTLIMIPTLLCIILITMFLMSLLTGSDKNEFSSDGGGDWLDSVFEELGAENTFGAKYVRYIYDLAGSGNFYISSQSNAQLLTRAKNTAIITLLGIAASLIIGIPAGIFSAIHHNKSGDNLVGIATLMLSSIPSFVLAIFLAVIFVLWLRVLPLVGFSTPKHIVMPVLVISAGGIALMTRMTRAASLEVLNKPYITVLRAKGISRGRIVYLHVLKNSLITVLSTLNNLTAQMLCSTLVVENFFSIPGLGQTMVKAISNRNQRSVLACVIILSLILMSASIFFDFLCAYANPQIRGMYKRGAQNKGEAM